MSDNFKSIFLTEQKDLLKQLLGSSIVDMNRHFDESPEKNSAFFDGPLTDIFQLVCEPLTIRFDSGLIIRITSAGEFYSLTVRIQKTVEGNISPEYTLFIEKNNFLISIKDEKYSHPEVAKNVLNKKISEIFILKATPLYELRREYGLAFITEDNYLMIIMNDGADLNVHFDKESVYQGTEWIPVK